MLRSMASMLTNLSQALLPELVVLPMLEAKQLSMNRWSSHFLYGKRCNDILLQFKFPQNTIDIACTVNKATN